MTFERNSRYYKLSDKQITTKDGTSIIYKERRFIPEQHHNTSSTPIISNGNRADHISYTLLGASNAYWKLGDANKIFSLKELERKGLIINVPKNMGHNE